MEREKSAQEATIMQKELLEARACCLRHATPQAATAVVVRPTVVEYADRPDGGG
jgi:hypothetical protein